jgi:predicted peptidase
MRKEYDAPMNAFAGRGSLLLALLAGACATSSSPSSALHAGFQAETIEIGGATHRYVCFVPAGYRSDQRWPLLVFLHGAGECGDDGWKQVAVGLGPAVLWNAAAWPCVILFPQKPSVDDAWEQHEAMVMAMVGKTQAQLAIDDHRICLTGLSQGGHGTWVLGARHPDFWAALAPICGYGAPAEIAPPLRSMPIWCFHGEDDKSVPCEQSKALVAAVSEAGGHADLTLYKATGHNSWDKAYRESTLAQWLMAAHRR